MTKKTLGPWLRLIPVFDQNTLVAAISWHRKGQAPIHRGMLPFIPIDELLEALRQIIAPLRQISTPSQSAYSNALTPAQQAALLQAQAQMQPAQLQAAQLNAQQHQGNVGMGSPLSGGGSGAISGIQNAYQAINQSLYGQYGGGGGGGSSQVVSVTSSSPISPPFHMNPAPSTAECGLAYNALLIAIGFSNLNIPLAQLLPDEEETAEVA